MWLLEFLHCMVSFNQFSAVFLNLLLMVVLVVGLFCILSVQRLPIAVMKDCFPLL